MLKLILTFAITFMSVTFASAQSSASAAIHAKIENFIAAIKVEDMNFGSFRSSPLPMELSTKNKGGQNDESAGNDFTPAFFRVQGNEFAYDITVQDRALALVSGNGSSAIRASGFTLLPEFDEVSETGERVFAVGATLHIQPATNAGHYQSLTPFVVVINYN